MPVPWPQLPYAAPAIDGGDAARDAIRQSGNVALYIRTEDGKPQEFWSEIDNILKDFETIRTEEAVRNWARGRMLRPSRLQGWDFVDLATRKDIVRKRELPYGSEESPWWPIADAPSIVVLFGRDFGQLIGPDPAKPPASSPGWASTPINADLLTASMPCVRQLARGVDGLDDDSCRQLTSELFWHSPDSKNCPFAKGTCKLGCHFVQELRGKGMRQTFLKSHEPTPPGHEILLHNAVVFGDREKYHKSQEGRLNAIPISVTAPSSTKSRSRPQPMQAQAGSSRAAQ
jgi:hypothetical protein